MKGALVFRVAATLVAGFVFAVSADTVAGPARAQNAEAIACGDFYEVVRGDTLHRIASRVYGSGNYQAIFNANRDLLPNTSSLEVGQRLLIPCADGSGPQTRADALTQAERAAESAPDDAVPKAKPEVTLAAVIAEPDEVGLLTGSDFAPFADERLPEGGMITEMVKLALGRAAPGHEANVTFVNDWSRHPALLGAGEFQVGFPWYKPDCAKADLLSRTMRERCSGFVFSDPVFAVEMGYYVRAGDPLTVVRSHDALAGKRICRPAGYFTFDLDQAGLSEPAVTRVVPRTAEECFWLLSQEEVDVVSVAASLAEPEISRLGLDGRVTEVLALATSQTLHAVAAESSAEGRAYIELLNKGLGDLLASGRWFEVASRHLGAFGMSLR